MYDLYLGLKQYCLGQWKENGLDSSIFFICKFYYLIVLYTYHLVYTNALSNNKTKIHGIKHKKCYINFRKICKTSHRKEDSILAKFIFIGHIDLFLRPKRNVVCILFRKLTILLGWDTHLVPKCKTPIIFPWFCYDSFIYFDH